MIGYYNYTVVLTYLSLLSAGAGIFVTLSGDGHPYLGVMFLLLCGLCDAFDGKVARMKKDRSEMECKFGVQIDSLSDLVAFGVLPACIGGAMLRRSQLFDASKGIADKICIGALFAILVLYILAAMIRLAYFNVTEEERQKKEEGGRKTFTGLPVTSAALIFPSFLLIDFVLKSIDLTLIYFVIILITAFLFLAKFEMKKPGLKGILIMLIAGTVELAAFAILWKLSAGGCR